MLRGVRVDGKLIRQQRMIRGLSQKSLADAAGISERTVRNAENSSVIEVHIASYLSTLFGIPLGDLVLERSKEQRSQTLQKWGRKFTGLYFETLSNQGRTDFKDLLHPAIEWRLTSVPDLEFAGEYSNIDGVVRHFVRIREWMSASELSIRGSCLDRLDGEGDVVYLRCNVELARSLVQTHSTCITFFCRFEDDLLRSVDQIIGIDRLAT